LGRRRTPGRLHRTLEADRLVGAVPASRGRLRSERRGEIILRRRLARVEQPVQTFHGFAFGSCRVARLRACDRDDVRVHDTNERVVDVRVRSCDLSPRVNGADGVSLREHLAASASVASPALLVPPNLVGEGNSAVTAALVPRRLADEHGHRIPCAKVRANGNGTEDLNPRRH